MRPKLEAPIQSSPSGLERHDESRHCPSQGNTVDILQALVILKYVEKGSVEPYASVPVHFVNTQNSTYL